VQQDRFDAEPDGGVVLDHDDRDRLGGVHVLGWLRSDHRDARIFADARVPAFPGLR
jgi:hypothetical protein